MIVVTGGAGFIGGAFVRRWCAERDEAVVVLDKLTYAANPESIGAQIASGQVELVEGDICDRALVDGLLARRPSALLHFAAESHVDRSIRGPAEFVATNIVGTFTLLEAARCAFERGELLPAFRFLHVSTDEVFGTLGDAAPAFSETTAYAPNSPYSASKASSDHLARAYHETYGLPVLTSNCSNNYGPYQFPEKLIPLMILNALERRPLPVYGDGMQVRDWLFVDDHCEAIDAILALGTPGETYNVGGRNEVANIVTVRALCRILDELAPHADGPFETLVSFVQDRPGHDRRYAVDCSKIERELGWVPSESFDSGLRRTVAWYLDNPDWIARVRTGAYRDWLSTHYRREGSHEDS